MPDITLSIPDVTVARKQYVATAKAIYRKDLLEVKIVLSRHEDVDFTSYRVDVFRFGNAPVGGPKSGLRWELEKAVKTAFWAALEQAGWTYDRELYTFWTAPQSVWVQWLTKIEKGGW